MSICCQEIIQGDQLDNDLVSCPVLFKWYSLLNALSRRFPDLWGQMDYSFNHIFTLVFDSSDSESMMHL